ncbi:LysR family transcriptional regulator [Pseudomaricurvus alcaniphilus]|uniref:LysR family transcriptional regulator n=1 Tax=Pseudomaricurvus alcaniphilus TaxID=1166482 RepID=UPI001407BC92|nr:LysR family transcriptional regulator [Pseudomaricurvus alcaniphilus]NHN37523.1 LysR family transcriptional regulator [Pseudomaricurvus alcaniphilus]
MNYQNLHLFVKVVEKGSFLAAAEAQQIPSSTVSRRIQQLEDELGYKLLHRSARKLALTEAGALFYRRCQPLYAELEAATLELEGELTAVTGNLRITAPVSLFNELLDEWFYEFLQTYPAIDMQLLLENRNIDLRDEAVDVAFRIGDAKIKDWVSRSLFHSRYILNCSQSFKHLHGSPEHPRELSEYPLIVPSRTATWLFSNAGGEVVEVTPQARFLTNELRAAAKATCAGLGLPITHKSLQRDRQGVSGKAHF